MALQDLLLVKFATRQKWLNQTIDPKDRYRSSVGRFGGFVISEEFAFLHIWKCGGTTIEKMGVQKSGIDGIRHTKWIGLVRDPIDHFLSGWAEFGYRRFERRHFQGTTNATLLPQEATGDYEERIRTFLQRVKGTIAYPETIPDAATHAHPQANFMINPTTRLIDPHMQVVGDLSEMKTVVEKVGGFQGWEEDVVGRDASVNKVKQMYFTRRRDLLSDDLILALCEFLQIDYFLFDFQPPEICIQEGGPLFFKWWGDVEPVV